LGLQTNTATALVNDFVKHGVLFEMTREATLAEHLGLKITS